MAYRTRVVVIAALVVTAVVAATLAFVWSSLRAVEETRLDARLCQEARRLASQDHDDEALRRLDLDVMDKLRVVERSQVLLRLERNGGSVAQSAAWPAGLALDRLEWKPAPGRRAGPEPPAAEPAPPPRDARGPDAAPPPGPARFSCAVTAFAIGDDRWRGALVAGPAGRGFVGADAAAAADELLVVLKATLRQVVPIALLLAAAGAWLLSAVAARPLQRLQRAMQGVSRKDMSRRLSPRGEDREFQALIGEYNAMLERLQASMEQASRFSADAAHELRTPLTILQGRLEQAIRKSEHRAIQADLTDMMEELGRLATITRKLLLLSRADAGQLALNRTRVDLAAQLDALAGDARMLAADGVTVTSHVERGLALAADELLLGQLLNNLVSNAVRYCKPGGWIDIAGRRSGAVVEVVIANACEPIAEAERARLFDRFHRLDPARNRRTEGSGLGLSIAREIARAHGGDLTLEPGAADEVRLRLQLPAT
ncbi:MAG: ATP-binding protein [Burkholderiales bacterium]